MYKIFEAYYSSVYVKYMHWCGFQSFVAWVYCRVYHQWALCLSSPGWRCICNKETHYPCMLHLWEKVVGLWSIGLKQSTGAIPVAVGWRSLAAWSAAACYAVGCQTNTACLLLPASNVWFIDRYSSTVRRRSSVFYITNIIFSAYLFCECHH